MLSWEEFTPEELRPAADRDDHRRRRRHLRHRLRRDVARAGQRHPDQGAGARTPAPTPTPAARRPRRASPARTPTSPASAARTTASTSRARSSACWPRSTRTCSCARRAPRSTGTSWSATMEMLDYPAPAVMDVYTPVRLRARHPGGLLQRASPAGGREPDAPAVRARPAPRRRRCTTGSPSTATPTSTRPGRPARWSTSTTTGQVQLLTTPLTPAEFALGEVRFKKQFRQPGRRARRTRAVPIDEYVELPVAAARRPGPVHLRDRRRPAPDQGRLLGLDRRPGRGPAPLLADAAVPVRRPRGAADRPAPLGHRGAARRSTSEAMAAAGDLAGRHRPRDVRAGDLQPGAGGGGLGGGFGGGRRSRRRRRRLRPRRPAPAVGRHRPARSTSTRPTSPCATTAAPATRSCRSSSRRPPWSSTVRPAWSPG